MYIFAYVYITMIDIKPKNKYKFTCLFTFTYIMPYSNLHKCTINMHYTLIIHYI